MTVFFPHRTARHYPKNGKKEGKKRADEADKSSLAILFVSPQVFLLHGTKIPTVVVSTEWLRSETRLLQRALL